MAHDIIDKIASLAKQRGFVFPSSEIYGGWEATYDFGPLGAEMLRNLRNLWWDEFVHNKDNIVGLDSAIISHPRVWEASGHVASFADAMVEDTVTNKRYRADHLIEEEFKKRSTEISPNKAGFFKPDSMIDKTILQGEELSLDGLSLEEFDKIITDDKILSPDGNHLSKAKHFNQLVEVEIGTTEETKGKAYLRGETCQPIFTNYELIKDSMRLKLPFGVAQIGKAFRNEIKVGPYFHRTREFEQMEIEMYIHPSQSDEYFNTFKEWSKSWLESLGLPADKLRFRDQEFKERAHYNKVATDVEYEFSFGWKEFQGIHYRSDWDLKRHGEFSQHDFSYTDEATGETFVPHVVEYSIGLNRLMLVLLANAYTEEEKRVVLKLDPKVAPYKAAVFPLVANKEEIGNKAAEVKQSLKGLGNIAWDDRGNIGKRYFSQDQIGTPWCITVDYQTLEDGTVTIRDRDTMEQIREKIENLKPYILERLG